MEKDGQMDALKSRAEIADLIHRYARNVRNREADDCAAIMTDDVVFVVREIDFGNPEAAPAVRKTTVGKEAVVASIVASTTSDVRVVPLVQNILVGIDGDEATSTCVMSARTWPPGREFIGEYEDRFRLVDGQWRFCARTFTMFLPAAG